MPVRIDHFLRLVDQLPDTDRIETAHYTVLKVHDKTFGYLWEATSTVGLKQTIAEQIALVAERPDVFEVQFTTSQFGWVVVQLRKINKRELAELLFEAWRLTAPLGVIDAHGDRLPR